MRPKHSNTSPAWIAQRFAKLEKLIRESNAAKKLQAATIGKGGLTIKDGGTLTANYPAGVGGGKGVWFGPVPPSESTEAPALGLQVSDETGEYIFQVLRQYPSTAYPAGQSLIAAAVSGLDFAASDFMSFTCVTPGAALNLNAFTGVEISGGSLGVHIQHSTTAAAANCFIDPSDSRIWRSTSSAKNKLDIEDAVVDTADVLALRGVTFRDKGQVEADPDTTARFSGFIAEELHELPTMRQFVVYDAEGEPEAIAYDRLTVALLAVLKDQDKRITALEAETAEP